MKTIKDIWFYFPVTILAIILLYHLIRIGLTVSQFPINMFYDGTSYMSQLYFLKEYGYFTNVPNWYNGFINMKYYSPLWYFLTLPFYLITNNINLSVYITLLILLSGLFIAFFYIGKYMGISTIKSVFYYLIFVFSPPFYFSVFILGRFPELMAFIFLFISFIFILHYKDKKLDRNFLLLAIPYSLILLSHPTEFLLFSFLLLGFFLVRSNKEKIFLIITIIIAILISSFWLIPFLDNKNVVISHQIDILSEISWGGKMPLFGNLMSIGNILVILFFLAFYFFWKNTNYNKKELLFYSPLLIYSILYFSRLYLYLPIIQNIYAITFNSFIFFVSFYLILNTNFELFYFKKSFLVSLQLVPIILLSYQFIYPVHYNYSDVEYDLLNLLDKIDNNYFILVSANYHANPLPAWPNMIAYLTITYNLTTPNGAYPQAANLSYFIELEKTQKLLTESTNCQLLKTTLRKLNIYYVLTDDEVCKRYSQCNFNKLGKTEYYCLYSTA